MCFWNICGLSFLNPFSFERLSVSLMTHPIFSLQSTVQSPISSICRHLIKPVLQQIRLLQVAWVTTSDWLKLRASHKYTQEWPTCCKTGLPWAGKSCNLCRFPSRWRTTLYFLQQVFATCNDSMKCIDYRFCSLSSLFLVADPRIRFRAWKAVESWTSCKENGRCSERVTVKRFVWATRVAQWWEHSPPNNVAWVEFVVGSLPCSKKFFSGYSGFPLSLKTNTFKF